MTDYQIEISFRKGSILMTSVFVMLLMVALVGMVKPFRFAPQVKHLHYVVAALALFVLVGITAPPSIDELARPAVAAAADSGVSLAIPLADIDGAPAEYVGKWHYSELMDEMRGETSHFARLEAENTIQLDFPYGEQRGQIEIRQSPQSGFELLIGVPSGKIMCNSYRNSYVSVKFGNGPIERFACTDTADGTNNMAIIRNGSKFLNKLKQSKRVMIEATFFQNGLQQMKFDTTGLKWE